MKFLLITKAGVVLDWTYDIDEVEQWQKACKTAPEYEVKSVVTERIG
jgi:hypothetical protein